MWVEVEIEFDIEILRCAQDDKTLFIHLGQWKAKLVH